MSWTLCTSGAAVAKAGANANATIVLSGATLAKWSDEAEGALCMRTRKDWVTAYGTVHTTFLGTLSDCCSDLIAMKIINYDMSGFTSRLEAQTMLDVLRDNLIKNLDVLREDSTQDVML